mmetsp:Transcript_24558/g.73717  ORF Transcript_24558/g.73717 Transcript_24558/m.73717 type:complete len:90 (-) Transcript_24558:41-310(-)
MAAVPRKSKKSQGFKARKREKQHKLQRTNKHKKGAPHVKNLANAVSRSKADKRVIFEECAKRARERRDDAATAGEEAEAPEAAREAMEE